MAKDDDLITHIKEEYRRSKSHQKKWRQEARELYDMVAGKQLSDTEKAELEEAGKPAIAFNRIDPVVSAVVGHQINNRQEIKYLPRSQGDIKPNETYSSAAEYFDQGCDAYEEISDAFWDMTICGMGFSEMRVDYDQNYEGDIQSAERIPPLEMGWDPSAKKRNIADSRYRYRQKWWSRKEAEKQWPKVKNIDVSNTETWLDAPESDELSEHDASRAWMYESDSSQWYKQDTDEILVLQWQEWEYEPMYVVGDPQNNKVIELSAKKFNRLKERIDDMGARYVKQMRKVYKQYFVVGDTILEKGDAPCPNHFSLQCMTARRDENTNTWYGLVRAMVDPQKWSNKLFSDITSIMYKNRTGGAFIETDALDDPREAEEQWAEENPLIKLKPGALQKGKILERNPIQYPQGLDRLMEFAIYSIPHVTGLNQELLGLVDRNQPGVLEAQRKRAGMTILAGMFDSLKLFQKTRAEVLLYFVQEYVTDGRLIRMVGEDGMEKYMPIVKDKETVKYDVVISESPQSPNQQMETFGALMELLPRVTQMGIPMPPDFLDHVPLPSTLTDKWKKHIAQQQNDPQKKQMQQEMAQMAKRLQAAEAAKDESVAKLNDAKTELTRVQAKLKPAEEASKAIERATNK